ncbi:MAG: hypothetical protein ACI92I_000455 [Acidimicrobiales bacterium]|jgi:hypothetical protein
MALYPNCVIFGTLYSPFSFSSWKWRIDGKTVGTYLADIGYIPKEIEVNKQIRPDFLLYDNEYGKEIALTDVCIRRSYPRLLNWSYLCH